MPVPDLLLLLMMMMMMMMMLMLLMLLMLLRARPYGAKHYAPQPVLSELLV